VAQVIQFSSAASVLAAREQLIKELSAATIAFVRATATVTERLVAGEYPTAAEANLEEATRAALMRVRSRLLNQKQRAEGS
jgi:hypothetical protein